jgi:hypothetical protein
MNDPIVEEVRRVRQEYAAQFDYDIRRIADDLRRQEEESGRQYLRQPTTPLPPLTAASESA